MICKPLVVILNIYGLSVMPYTKYFYVMVKSMRPKLVTTSEFFFCDMIAAADIY